MLAEKARHYYLDENCNCAVSVLKAGNEVYQLGLSPEDIIMLKGFGGGMGCGNVCGALSGCVAVLSKLHGGNENFMDEVKEFVGKFETQLSATDCSTLKPKYKTEESRCFRTVELAAELLEETVGK